MVLMKKPSVIDAPSGGAPEQAPRWDLTGTEGCGDGIRFLEGVRRWSNVGPTRVEGAPGGGGHAPLPRAFLLDPLTCTPSLLDCFLSKNNFSRRFHSVWTPCYIPFLRNPKTGKKQQFWAGPPVNRLVPKIIYKWIIKPNNVQNRI